MVLPYQYECQGKKCKDWWKSLLFDVGKTLPFLPSGNWISMLFRFGRVSVNTRKDGSISAGCGAEEWSGGMGLVLLHVMSTYLTSGLHPVSDSLAQVTIFIVYVTFSVACGKQGQWRAGLLGLHVTCYLTLDLCYHLILCYTAEVVGTEVPSNCSYQDPVS